MVAFGTVKFPDVIRIEPSSLCNLRCTHCPTGVSQGEDRGIMSEQTFAVIMKHLRKRIPRVVVPYHGGEATLNENVWFWISLLKRLGVKTIKMNTNGTTMTDHMIGSIIASGLDRLTVSIDGETPEENDRIRRGSNCRQIIENIQRLLALKKDTPLVTIANVQFNGDTGVPAFLREAFGNAVIYLEKQYFSWINPDKPYPQMENNFCPFIYETMTIRWNGDVVPCCYDITSKYVTGNIYESSLEEIWNNERYQQIREGVSSNNPVELCRNCCKGGDHG